MGDERFHSACVRILRREQPGSASKNSTFSIYSTTDGQHLVALVLRDLDLDPKRYQPQHYAVSNARRPGSDEEWRASRVGSGAARHAPQGAEDRRTGSRMPSVGFRQANAMDFDDLIM